MYSSIQNLIKAHSERIHDFDPHVDALLTHYILSIPEIKVKKIL